jgi:hypothetical protein
MAPAMKKAAAGAQKKAMTKGALAEALASASGLKKGQCAAVVSSLADIAAKEAGV